MANHWLLKTEPSSYSYDDLVRERKTVWDGVRNPVALKHLRAMAPGDEAFVYHTGGEKQVVGVAKVMSKPYADPAAGDPKLAVVDLTPVKRLANPVTLAWVKADPRFAGWELVRLPRLSIMPVPGPLWKVILAAGR